jgi:type VI secretion system protein VasG
VDLITSRCTEVESGGRMIDAVLTSTLLPQVSRELLERTLQGAPMTSISVTAKDGQFVVGM